MSNLATIVNNILADSGIDDINVVVTTGSYANPPWITSLAWSKITGSPLGDYLPLAGGTMTGNINWAQTDRGLTWAFNTDGAYIKFYNTSDGDTDSRLEFATIDNNNEYFRWGHVPSGGSFYESMRLVPNSSGNAQLIVSGNVGVGVTPSAWRNIFNAIQIGYTGTLYALTTSNATEQVNLASNYYQNSAGNELRIQAGFATRYQQGSGEHRWSTAGNSTANSGISFTQAMTLDASGNLLVGTTSSGFDTGTGIRLERSGQATIRLVGQSSGGEWTMGSSGMQFDARVGYIRFITGANDGAATERMRITSGGSLLLGTTSDVSSVGKFVVNYGSDGNFGIILNNTYTATSNNGYFNRYYNNGTEIATFYAGNSAGSLFNIVGKDGLAFATGGTPIGTERMRITSSGELLINTTSDAGDYKLQVNGNVYSNGNFFATGASEIYYQLLGYNNSYATIRSNVGFGGSYNSMSFLVNTNAATNAQGNTTLSSWIMSLGGNLPEIDSFYIQRSAAGNFTFSTLLKLSSTGTLTLNSYGAGSKTGTVAYNLAVDSSGNVIETAGGVVDGSGTASYVPKWQDANTLTNSIIFDNGTRVGVSTITPRTKLEVNGGLPTSIPTRTNTTNGIAITDGGAIYGRIGVADLSASGAGYPTYIQAGDWDGANYYNLLLNTLGGSVGIGTTNPLTALHVNDGVNVSNLTMLTLSQLGNTGNRDIVNFRMSFNNGNTPGIMMSAIKNASAGTDLTLSTGANSNGALGERVRILSNGFVGINESAPGYRLSVSDTNQFIAAFDNPAVDQLVTVNISNSAQSTAGVNTAAATMQLVGKAGTSTHGRHAWIGAEGVASDTFRTKVLFKVRGESNTGYQWSGAAEAPTIMTLDGNGFVGVNTKTPGVALDVSGSGIRITNATPNIYFNNTVVQWKAYMPTGLNSFAINDAVRDVLTLGYNGAASYFQGCNLGIGTALPAYKLHVVTDAVAGRQNMSNISRTTGNWVRFTNPQYSADASMGIILRVFPDSDLRQGAGIIASGGSNNACTNLDLFVTTSPDGLGGTSYSALNINGFSGSATFSGSINTPKLFINTTLDYGSLNIVGYNNDGINIIDQRTSSGAGVLFKSGITFRDYYLGSSASIDFYHNQYYGVGVNRLGFSFLGGERMSILYNGNVGINNTSPSARLHVQIDENFAGGVNYNTPHLFVRSGASAASGNVTRFAMGIFDGAQVYLDTICTSTGGGAADLAIATRNVGAPTEKMRITSGGNVGIGTTSPGNRLEVNGGSIGSNIARFTTGGGGGGTRGMTIYSNDSYVKLQVTDNAGSLSTWAHLVLNPDGGYVGIGNTNPSYSLDVTGNARFTSSVTATSFFESSDERLKSNIIDLDVNVSSIIAKSYLKNGVEEIGYIAQDVKNILPSAISIRENGYLDLSYRQIHTAKIAALEKEVAELKKQLKNK
jgi:hypothetical protein